SIAGHALTTTDQTFSDGTTGSFNAHYTFNDVTGNGEIDFTYTLLRAVTAAGDRPLRNFEADVTDTDGETVSGTLSIALVNDKPVAQGDNGSLGGTQVITTGNLLTNDTQGADGAHVVGVAKGSNITEDLDGRGFTIDGQVGQLHVESNNGNYTYTSI